MARRQMHHQNPTSVNKAVVHRFAVHQTNKYKTQTRLKYAV